LNINSNEHTLHQEDNVYYVKNFVDSNAIIASINNSTTEIIKVVSAGIGVDNVESKNIKDLLNRNNESNKEGQKHILDSNYKQADRVINTLEVKSDEDKKEIIKAIHNADNEITKEILQSREDNRQINKGLSDQIKRSLEINTFENSEIQMQNKELKDITISNDAGINKEIKENREVIISHDAEIQKNIKEFRENMNSNDVQINCEIKTNRDISAVARKNIMNLINESRELNTKENTKNLDAISASRGVTSIENENNRAEIRENRHVLSLANAEINKNVKENREYTKKENAEISALVIKNNKAIEENRNVNNQEYKDLKNEILCLKGLIVELDTQNRERQEKISKTLRLISQRLKKSKGKWY